MLIVNTLGTKISNIWGIRMSVGVLYMPLLFILSDSISEVFSKEDSKLIANISTFLLCLLILSFYICIHMPADPSWNLQLEFEKIFSQSLRMSIASVISFFVSQRLDILLFFMVKKLTREKFLFARNIISTAVSQLLDTILFMFLAFYRMTDAYTISYIFSLILPYYIIKLVLTFLSTPLCYLLVWWCKGKPLN